MTGTGQLGPINWGRGVHYLSIAPDGPLPVHTTGSGRAAESPPASERMSMIPFAYLARGWGLRVGVGG